MTRIERIESQAHRLDNPSCCGINAFSAPPCGRLLDESIVSFKSNISHSMKLYVGQPAVLGNYFTPAVVTGALVSARESCFSSGFADGHRPGSRPR